MLAVSGEENKDIYSGKMADEIYRPEGGAIQSIADGGPTLQPAHTKEERIEWGRRVYTSTCIACHQPNGEGFGNAFPPIASSDFLNADKQRAIGSLVHGLSGEITINGETYNGVMPALGLSDEDIANVLTFVYNSWGNSGLTVGPDEVKRVRAQGK